MNIKCAIALNMFFALPGAFCWGAALDTTPDKLSNASDHSLDLESLYNGIKKGEAWAIDYFVQHTENVNKADKNGITPLMMAAMYGQTEGVKRLLSIEGIKLNVTDFHYAQTPLAWAAQNNHEAVVKLLVQVEGIDLDKTDSSGYSPLANAAMEGHLAVVDLLIRARANVNKSDDRFFHGYTPLRLAYLNKDQANYQEIINLLVEGKADVNGFASSEYKQRGITNSSKKKLGCRITGIDFDEIEPYCPASEQLDGDDTQVNADIYEDDLARAIQASIDQVAIDCKLREMQPNDVYPKMADPIKIHGKGKEAQMAKVEQPQKVTEELPKKIYDLSGGQGSSEVAQMVEERLKIELNHAILPVPNASSQAHYPVVEQDGASDSFETLSSASDQDDQGQKEAE